METAVANLVRPGSKATVLINGYFGDRLAQMCERYGATVTRLNGEWGRAFDPSALEKSLASTKADVVALVHGETSTGVRNPVKELAAIARKHDALTIVDAVTSFGAVELEVGAWGVDVCYSCTQKGLGAPSGLAPIVFTPRAMERAAKCPSFYFDLNLLKDYWINRKYHHTMSSALLAAIYEALIIVDEEGLEARWARHERNHKLFVAGLAPLGLSLLPPESDRLHSLNTVKIPEGVDDAAVRKLLLEDYSIEIGGGLGPLAGRIWRVGLMGNSSSPRLVVLLLGALQVALAKQKVNA
jgi:alanine-glyoxylate transaminase/serine-glyoxylate transaminase/serine-pyruvate transaminase